MKEFLRNWRAGKGTALFLMAVLGAVLLLFSSGNKNQKKAETDLVPTRDDKQILEKELSELVLALEGVSRAKVSISLESGNEYIWDNGKNTLVLAGRVRGVAVVCEGGDDPVIRQKITSMLCALFDLPLKAVSVSQ